MNTLDIIIAGSGAAGLTAALYASRNGYNFAVVDPSPPAGSSVALADEVDNYTGFSGISGFELMQKFYAHAKSLGTRFVSDEIKRIEKTDGLFNVICAKNSYKAKTVIYSMGAAHKKLGVCGEEELAGKGVSYCAVCDGFFFKDKVVVVAGGGNTAVTEALYLSKICCKVFLVHRRNKLRAEKVSVQKLENTGNAEIIYNNEIVKISGISAVSSVQLKDGRELRTDGVFVAVGLAPRSFAVKDICNTDENGYIIADESCKTSLDGLFAAGDVRTKRLRQIVTACCDGANAVAGVNDYLGIKA